MPCAVNDLGHLLLSKCLVTYPAKKHHLIWNRAAVNTFWLESVDRWHPPPPPPPPPRTQWSEWPVWPCNQNRCAWLPLLWTSQGQLAPCNPRGRAEWAEWALSSTDRMRVRVKEPIQIVFFCFYPTLKMKIQPLNYLKTVSKISDLSSMIAMTAHYFGALSQVHAIGHCVIGHTVKSVTHFDLIS